MPLSIGANNPLLSGAATIEWLDDFYSINIPLAYPCIIQFWAISCPVCKMNMPRLQQLVNTYAAQGLQLVSVHMPRMKADMDTAKVQAVREEMGLIGPCAIDNDHAIGDRFETGGVWPCYFLFDTEGKLRSRAAGALGLKMAENSLKRILGAPDEKAARAGEMT